MHPGVVGRQRQRGDDGDTGGGGDDGEQRLAAGGTGAVAQHEDHGQAAGDGDSGRDGVGGRQAEEEGRDDHRDDEPGRGEPTHPNHHRDGEMKSR